MNRTWSVRLDTPAHEMAQEEILKQVAFLSRDLGRQRFSEGGRLLEFDAPESDGAALTVSATELAKKIQRGLRSLKRKIVYRSKAMDSPVFRGDGRTRITSRLIEIVIPGADGSGCER